MQGIRLIRRRRGQGMTEYIVLVGICALLLIAAVNLFAGNVDEAIQGTTRALISRTQPPSGTPGAADSNIDAQGFKRGWSAETDQGITVKLKDDNGQWVPWANGAPYTRENHGRIVSRPR